MKIRLLGLVLLLSFSSVELWASDECREQTRAYHIQLARTLGDIQSETQFLSTLLNEIACKREVLVELIYLTLQQQVASDYTDHQEGKEAAKKYLEGKREEVLKWIEGITSDEVNDVFKLYIEDYQESKQMSFEQKERK